MLAVSLLAAAGVLVLGLIVVATIRRRGAETARRPAVPAALLGVLGLALVPPGLAFAPVPQAQAAPQARAVPQAQAAPQEHTTTVRYGPLLLPPYLNAAGHEGGHGGHGGQMITYAAPAYDMPCQNCYITGVEPDLVYADGTPANYDTGAMLHHTVVFDPSKEDATCGRRGVGLVTGQRVFAAGNERTSAHLPPGYGYRVGSIPFGALSELMNMSAQPQQVYITMKISWIDAADARLKEVTPVWLDVDNCGDSQYSIPAGPSHTTWTWKSTMAGDIVTTAGHVHDQGISITLSNATRNEQICESVAGYSGASHHEGHVDSMSTCVGDPLATVAEGDELMIDSYYHSSTPDGTVMGIMLAYLHQN